MYFAAPRETSINHHSANKFKWIKNHKQQHKPFIRMPRIMTLTNEMSNKNTCSEYLPIALIFIENRSQLNRSIALHSILFNRSIINNIRNLSLCLQYSINYI